MPETFQVLLRPQRVAYESLADAPIGFCARAPATDRLSECVCARARQNTRAHKSIATPAPETNLARLLAHCVALRFLGRSRARRCSQDSGRASKRAAALRAPNEIGCARRASSRTPFARCARAPNVTGSAERRVIAHSCAAAAADVRAESRGLAGERASERPPAASCRDAQVRPSARAQPPIVRAPQSRRKCLPSRGTW